MSDDLRETPVIVGATEYPIFTEAAVAEARRLRRQCPITGLPRPWLVVSVLLRRAGFKNPETGQPYTPETIRLALERSA